MNTGTTLVFRHGSAVLLVKKDIPLGYDGFNVNFDRRLLAFEFDLRENDISVDVIGRPLLRRPV